MGKAKVTTTTAAGADPAPKANTTPTATATAPVAKAAGLEGAKYKGQHESPRVGVEIKGHYVEMLAQTAKELGLAISKSNYHMTAKGGIQRAGKGIKCAAWLGPHRKTSAMLQVPIPSQLNIKDAVDFVAQNCKNVHILKIPNGGLYTFDRSK